MVLSGAAVCGYVAEARPTLSALVEGPMRMETRFAIEFGARKEKRAGGG